MSIAWSTDNAGSEAQLFVVIAGVTRAWFRCGVRGCVLRLGRRDIREEIHTRENDTGGAVRNGTSDDEYESGEIENTEECERTSRTRTDGLCMEK